MKPTKNNVAIRKRTQIANANRTMFIWIVVASVLVGSAAVVSYFFAQKALHNEQIISEKQKTVDTLKGNLEAVPQLQDEIRVLDTNSDLSSIKANDSDQAIQVILDALPADANSLALGASLQNRILSGIPGLAIDAINVQPVVGVELEISDETMATTEPNAMQNVINFQLSVTGNQEQIKQVLTNLERSIRTIEVLSVRIETNATSQVMTVSARAFYEPKRVIELKDKDV